MALPRNADIMVWDNGGKTADRYTAAIKGKKGWDIYTMSPNAMSPNGVNQFSHSATAFDDAGHGKRIPLHKLPKEVRDAIRKRGSEDVKAEVVEKAAEPKAPKEALIHLVPSVSSDTVQILVGKLNASKASYDAKNKSQKDGQSIGISIHTADDLREAVRIVGRDHVEETEPSIREMSKRERMPEEESMEIKEEAETDLWMQVDDDKTDVKDTNTNGYLPMVTLDDRTEWYVAQDSKEAGQAAMKYWQEMAKSDPKELAALIGDETLVQWGLGQHAGPGSSKVSSLKEWIELWEDTPEEQWASYDGEEHDVILSKALADALGLNEGAAVAYRHN